jgi:hypothetical protein
MVSMITAGRKIDKLSAKAANGSARAARKLTTAQTQIQRLALMNGGPMPVGPTSPFGNLMASKSVTKSEIGLTGNFMASAGATEGSRFVQGYFRGALGNVGAGGLMGEAQVGANRAVSHLAMALNPSGKAGLGIDNVTGKLTGRFAGVYESKAALALSEGAFKTLGVKGVMQAATTKTGAMALGARTAAMAIPGLNLLATASLVYDLGKMGGEVVKSGINLAKDAVKSMKGSIDKPMFGMGYKDNEVAATSRARGVAAIQNSRLNARSALGSEGAMMASHFG